MRHSAIWSTSSARNRKISRAPQARTRCRGRNDGSAASGSLPWKHTSARGNNASRAEDRMFESISLQRRVSNEPAEEVSPFGPSPSALAIGSTPRCRHRWDSPWKSVRVGDPGRLQRLSDSRADKLEQRAAFGLRASRALLLAIMKLQLINVCESLLSCPLLISWPCLGIAISRSAEKRPNCSTFGCVSARPIFGMLLPALRCRDRDREFDGC
jgi:hypothetical protein